MEKLALINYTKYTDVTVFTTQIGYIIDYGKNYKGKKIKYIINNIKKDYDIISCKYIEKSNEIITIIMKIRRKENDKKKNNKERFI